MRERRFQPVGLGRRGLDPGEVHAFLDRVAANLPAAQRLARVASRWLLVLPQTGGLAEQFVYNIRSPNRPLEELPNDEPQ